MQLQIINAIASTPISEASFGGEDVRYNSEYEGLERELAKAGSLHGNEQPDWETVHEGSVAILTSQSKDLRVATWLCWSLLETKGTAGLCSGLQMLGDLCDRHWPELHPRKERTRIAALNWLLSRLESAADQRLNSETETLISALQHLHNALAAQLKDQAPDLQPLCRKVNAAQQTTTTTPAVSSAASDTTQNATTATKSASTPPPASIANAKDAHKALRALQDQARPLCHWWLSENHCDLRALRLSRTLLWLPIDALPSHDANHKTGLRNLPTDRIAAYRERLSQGQHAALLTEAEASIARAPFWLDGHYLAWQCCDALGASEAAEEIERQLAWQLTRLPGLEKLRFFDDSPFADSSTQSWINSRVMVHGTTAQASSITFEHSAEHALTDWDKGLENAISTLRNLGLKAAVQELGEQIKQARSERSAFYWRLAQARLCFQARQYELAKAQLESLHQQLQAQGLDKWEPDLNLDVLRLLHSCCDLLPQNQTTRERKDEIYHRLCHLDLGVVLDQALGA
ncbi:type VI secretion system protein TssA [Halopseudomonas sp.]|uniref:type VI secretion system protein TssA n=1 Tax=Halopseudomonas sp. TaxID=2901191 RepID=UPI0030025070